MGCPKGAGLGAASVPKSQSQLCLHQHCSTEHRQLERNADFKHLLKKKGEDASGSPLVCCFQPSDGQCWVSHSGCSPAVPSVRHQTFSCTHTISWGSALLPLLAGHGAGGGLSNSASPQHHPASACPSHQASAPYRRFSPFPLPPACSFGVHSFTISPCVS